MVKEIKMSPLNSKYRKKTSQNADGMIERKQVQQIIHSKINQTTTSDKTHLQTISLDALTYALALFTALRYGLNIKTARNLLLKNEQWLLK